MTTARPSAAPPGAPHLTEPDSRPFTLLHVITDLDVGGTELSLARLVASMDRARFRHHVVSLLPAGPVAATIRDAGIEVGSLDMPPGRITVSGLGRLRRLIAEIQPDLVNSWLYHADLLSTMALLPGSRVPLVWNLRAAHMDMARYSWVSRATRHLCAWLSRRPELIIANSTAGRDYHVAFGYRAKAWDVIFNGIDTDRFQPDADARRAIREELGVPAAAPLVGLLARHDAMKGHPVFLDAARRIAEARPDAHFLLAGTGVEPAAPAFAEWLAAHPAIAPRVHLLGRRSDTPRLMASLDVYCSPSLGEGFPNAPAEAMASGVPAVASDAGDSRQIAGDVGIVVPVGDAAGLAAGCLALIGEDAQARLDRSRRARARIVDHFNMPRATRAYEDALIRVLDARHARTPRPRPDPAS
jgi:glycosyltransferase involved in cell wall biosynthesis